MRMTSSLKKQRISVPAKTAIFGHFHTQNITKTLVFKNGLCFGLGIYQCYSWFTHMLINLAIV